MDIKTLEAIIKHAQAPAHTKYEVLENTSHYLYIMLIVGLTHYGLYKISWDTGTFVRMA